VKIGERKKIGIHIPVMSLTSDILVSAITEVQTEGIKTMF
jgi:hypothetical protein